MRIFSLFLFLLIVVFDLPAQETQEQTLPEGIMAVRGDGSVSREMFDAKLSKIPEKDRTGVLRSAERLKKILADLLITSQLKADAVAAGFDTGDILYRMRLAAEIELANAWLDHYVDSQPAADYKAMASEYYLLNKDKIRTVPTRDVSHLLVSNEKRSPEEVKALAQAYLDQILLDPTVFDELVLLHSDDPSANSNKGHFRAVKKGDMVESFEEASFSLQAPGDISGLVYSPYGIHIIRLDAITPSRILAFEEVQAQLESNQEKDHKERVRNTYLTELGTMKAQVSDVEIQAMVDRYFFEDVTEENSKEPESE